MSRLFAAVAVVCLLSARPVLAQRHKVDTIDTGTPEGQLFKAIGAESDSAKKLELMEQFVSTYPKHGTTPWMLSQMQAEYAKAGNADKVLSSGEALLALDPDDLDAAYANLKAAEKKNDPDAVIKWSAATSAAAKKTVAAPKPADADEDTWKKSIDYAKQLDTYSEYAVYASALQTQDPAKVLALGDALEAHNKDSQYLPGMLGKYAAAGRQGNQVEKAAAFGERAYARNQVNDDMLLLMAEQSMNKQQFEKTEAYAGKALESVGAAQKPEGVSDADWQKKKDGTLGVAYWMQGVALSSQSKFPQADKALRASLPFIKDNQYLLGGATFHLGLANYRMAKEGKNAKLAVDALKFSQQSAAIKSPFQEQAAKNVKVIQTEYKIK